MKTQMLIVKGSPNVGKSTSVKIAFKLLLQLVIKRYGPTDARFLYLTNREVAAVIWIGTIRVGISTRGDNQKEIERALNFFLKQKCKVVVCAIRSQHTPLGTAQLFARNMFHTTPVEWKKDAESDAKNHAVADVRFANKIRKWVFKAITGVA